MAQGYEIVGDAPDQGKGAWYIFKKLRPFLFTCVVGGILAGTYTACPLCVLAILVFSALTINCLPGSHHMHTPKAEVKHTNNFASLYTLAFFWSGYAAHFHSFRRPPPVPRHRLRSGQRAGRDPTAGHRACPHLQRRKTLRDLQPTKG